MSFKFQVDLAGIIKLLSEHLYSTPQVYIRELLQNGVDAIRARQLVEGEHSGAVKIKTFDDAGTPTLVFTDNGIGLTEDEIHRFLATIGQSSKRDEFGAGSGDFIGQFGIGLLSCFVVSDEIHVVTRSATGESKTVEWRGFSDGTYSISFPTEEIPVGTRVTMRCKSGSENYFDTENVRRTAQHYGGLLPFPITLMADGNSFVINEELPPWKRDYFTAQEEREAFLDYGRKMFETDFFDYIRLESAIGDVHGAAYVLPFSPSLASKKTHRVYLKNMLLSESAEGLLPDWAFFVKSVVNVNNLRPTASRESFYEDSVLIATRAALGSSLRSYLIELSRTDTERLQRLISIHYLSIKALAVEDDEFFRLFIDWLPFETSLGWMSLGEYKERSESLYFIPSRDQFRQMSQVAAAQGVCIVNSSYVHDTELLIKHSDIFPALHVEQVTPSSFTHTFALLTLDEQDETADFIRAADGVLRSFRCRAEMRRFSPAELPVLFLAGEDAAFRRSVEQAKEVADSLWSDMLDNLAAPTMASNFSQLCFNYSNRLVAKISRMTDKDLQKLAIQTLYVQSLLLSHRPLNANEMRLMNDGLLGLLEWSVDVEGGWIQ